MNWSSWSDFVAMGGYGFYVWGSFGVSAVVIAAEIVSLRARRTALRQAARAAGASVEFARSAHEA